MKTFIIFSLASVWIVISGFMLYMIGKENVSYHPAAPSSKANEVFSTDNVLISFEYPNNLTYTIEGDLKDLSGYRVITLTNKAEEFYIYIKQDSTLETLSMCRLYNDCEFANPDLLFRLNDEDFPVINTQFNAVFPKDGGMLDTWESDEYITLDSTSPSRQQLYYVFTKYPEKDGVYWLKIPLQDNLTVEITYMFYTDNVSPDLINEVRNTIVTALETLKW